MCRKIVLVQNLYQQCMLVYTWAEESVCWTDFGANMTIMCDNVESTALGSV